jgi:hypothetical protein
MKSYDLGFKDALQKFGFDMPHWAGPVAKHVVGGAIPGALLGLASSGEDPETGESNTLKRSLIGAGLGGLAGLGVDAAGRSLQRGDAVDKALREALKRKTWNPAKRDKQLVGGSMNAERLVARNRGIVQDKMPLYGTPEDWANTKLERGELVHGTSRKGLSHKELKHQISMLLSRGGGFR